VCWRHCELDPQSPLINGGLRVKPAMTVKIAPQKKSTKKQINTSTQNHSPKILSCLKNYYLYAILFNIFIEKL
jgi:hypothetical protein